MTKTINQLTTLGTIDRTADLLPLWDTSGGTTNKMTVNNVLGFTGGDPVSTSDTQSLTNKTLGITNTITVLDTLFTLQDNSDNTKQAQFQLSGITTGTTRTYTLPNVSDTLVSLTATQTLTNKTLTSPTINTATIVNPTITVDTVSEYTAANGVTIDGVKLKDGALATNNSVVTANITDSAVTPAKILTGTGSSWSWQAFTPSWTNLTVGTGGNAANVGAYIQIGKTVFYRLYMIFGTAGPSMGTLPRFVAPVAPSAEYYRSSIGLSATVGQATLLDAATTEYHGHVRVSSTAPTTSFDVTAWGSASTYVNVGSVTATVPFTWAAGDGIYITGHYEAA